MSAPRVNALLTKQAVNCGDHGQDITTAVTPLPGETVEHFVSRVLSDKSWRGEFVPHDDWYVTLRIVAPEVESDGPIGSSDDEVMF